MNRKWTDISQLHFSNEKESQFVDVSRYQDVFDEHFNKFDKRHFGFDLIWKTAKDRSVDIVGSSWILELTTKNSLMIFFRIPYFFKSKSK